MRRTPALPENIGQAISRKLSPVSVVIRLKLPRALSRGELKLIRFIGMPSEKVWARTDEGQIDFPGFQQFIYFAVGFALDKLDFMTQLFGDKVQQLVIIDHGLLG